ncbi:MAG: GntR family transcriptional regulator [Devosia sp.]
MTDRAEPGRLAFDRTRQIAPQLLEHLRERILSLDLAPGTTLSRPQLQKQFGLSQTPLRDALLKLEEEGLVTIYPQYKTLVSLIDVEQARQAHFMRRAIEVDAVRLLARERPNAVEALTRANVALAETARAGDLTAFLLADRAFHHVIFVEAGLLALWPIIRRNSGNLDRLRRLNLPNVGMAKVIALHAKVSDAIASGDQGRAGSAMHEHLSSTLTVLDRAREAYPGLVV